MTSRLLNSAVCIVVNAFIVMMPANAQQNPFKSAVPSLERTSEYRLAIEKNLSAIYPMWRGDVTITTAGSAPGQSAAASGVVVYRTADSIAIDLTPCQAQKTVRSFLQPFRESPVSDERCSGRTYPRVQVIQLGR